MILRTLGVPSFVLAASLFSVSHASPVVDCPRGGADCRTISIAGDAPFPTPTFTGHADPSLIADPLRSDRIWLAYSYLTGKRATGNWGRTVGVPVVETHLAVSDDKGRNWQLHSTLWASTLTPDPEGQSRDSYFGSETPSLAVNVKDGQPEWFSVRLHYFLEPESAYKPRFATGWTMRVARARGETPAALASAEDVMLGVKSTAKAYGVDLDLSSMSPELSDCAMWNNPIVTHQGGRLVLVTECLVFRGKTPVEERTRMVVFSTDAKGSPKAWSWRYDGVIADHKLAVELGGDKLVSPEIQRARDGTLIFIASPQKGKGAFGMGCVVMELEGLAPPRLRRDASGRVVIRARQTSPEDASWRTGACTFASSSQTGMITVGAKAGRGLDTRLLATGLNLD